jgi:hypothetical protein
MPRVLLVLTGCAALVGCTTDPPILCASGLADGGCSYHVEVHCGDLDECGAGTQVLDAGSCLHDSSKDVIGCG